MEKEIRVVCTRANTHLRGNLAEDYNCFAFCDTSSPSYYISDLPPTAWHLLGADVGQD